MIDNTMTEEERKIKLRPQLIALYCNVTDKVPSPHDFHVIMENISGLMNKESSEIHNNLLEVFNGAPYKKDSDGNTIKDYNRWDCRNIDRDKMISLTKKLAEINGVKIPSAPLHIINKDDHSKVYFIAKYIKESLCVHASETKSIGQCMLSRHRMEEMGRDLYNRIVDHYGYAAFDRYTIRNILIILPQTTEAGRLLRNELTNLDRHVVYRQVYMGTTIPTVNIDDMTHLEEVIDGIIQKETNKRLISTVDEILYLSSFYKMQTHDEIIRMIF